jgi:hypothetical protein
MAEALAIIGLAANVAQFLEYGINFVRTMKKAYDFAEEAGRSSSELELVAETIKRHCARITSFPGMANLSQDEQEIKNIAEQCGLVADELIGVLESLRPSSTPSKRRLWTAIKAAKSELSKKNKTKIQELENRMNRLYHQLEASLSNLLQRYVSEFKRSRKLWLNYLRTHHSRVMQAIRDLTEKNESMNITFPNKLVEIQEAINQRIDESVFDLSSLLISLQGEAEQSSKAQKLLKSLMFPSMKIRESTIEVAHRETLGWVLDKEKTTLAEWLKTGSDVYWISGLVSFPFIGYLSRCLYPSIKSPVSQST